MAKYIFSEHSLRENAKKLRANLEKMTPEMKKQYAPSLAAFKRQLWKQADEEISSLLFLGCQVIKGSEGAEEVVADIKAAYNDLLPSLKEALVEFVSSQDVDKFYDFVFKESVKLEFEVYSKYFKKHLKKTGDAAFPVYSEIYQMYWDKANGYWVNCRSNADGSLSFGHGFKVGGVPPTDEEAAKKKAWLLSVLAGTIPI